MTIRPSIARVMALLAAAVLLGRCTGLVETRSVDDPGTLSSPSCQTALGSYYLPKALLTITATSDPSATPPKMVTLSQTVTVADREHLYCLDYLWSPSSKDALIIDRNEKGLLRSINSSVEDRTPAIATALIQTAENLTIAASRTTALQAQALQPVTLQFDPFAWRDLLLVKKALRPFGLCFYVEGFSFPTDGLNPAQIRAAANRWCSTDASQTAPYEHPLYQLANAPVLPDLMRRGVLYRPKTAHKIVILAKADPGSPRSPWELYQTTRIEMPNATPVLAIEVERALFTTRSTTVNFSDGTLTDVGIDKQSEAAGFVQIPLVAAQAIAQVPGEILKFRLADVQGHAALIQAQGNLLNALADYSRTISQNNGDGTGRPKSAAVRSGQFVGACIDAGGSPAQCRDSQASPR